MKWSGLVIMAGGVFEKAASPSCNKLSRNCPQEMRIIDQLGVECAGFEAVEQCGEMVTCSFVR